VPKENEYPGKHRAHLRTASKDLDSSEGNHNRAQEDALPPTRREESGRGAVPIERNVRAALVATVSGKVTTNPTPGEVGSIGLHQRNEKTVSTKALRIRTPMGRESSTKAQFSDLHRHFPAIGSQNGVEQLPGTGQGMSWGTIWEAQRKLTAKARLLTRGYRLFGVRVESSWGFLGAPVLKKKPSARSDLHYSESLTHV